MAAGIGKRLQPITFSTPKPLVKVHGVRMIDSIINALHQNGIHRIFIVVGYLKEQFTSLETEYPGISLIENPRFDTCNNISSLYVARKHIPGSIILDGDQVIHNPSILDPTFTRSGYNCIWTEEPTNEWLLTVKDEVVTHCSRTGGERGWQLFSISRWNDEDGSRLQSHLELEFSQKGNTQLFWDDVALFCHPEEYRLGIREMHREDVTEVDSYEELLSIDASHGLEKE